MSKHNVISFTKIFLGNLKHLTEISENLETYLHTPLCIGIEEI